MIEVFLQLCWFIHAYMNEVVYIQKREQRKIRIIPHKRGLTPSSNTQTSPSPVSSLPILGRHRDLRVLGNAPRRQRPQLLGAAVVVIVGGPRALGHRRCHRRDVLAAAVAVAADDALGALEAAGVAVLALEARQVVALAAEDVAVVLGGGRVAGAVPRRARARGMRGARRGAAGGREAEALEDEREEQAEGGQVGGEDADGVLDDGPFDDGDGGDGVVGRGGEAGELGDADDGGDGGAEGAWLADGFCGEGRGMGRDSQGSETEEQGYGGLGAAGELGLLEEPDG